MVQQTRSRFWRTLQIAMLLLVFTAMSVSASFAAVQPLPNAQSTTPTPTRIFEGALPEVALTRDSELLSQPRVAAASKPLVLAKLKKGDRVTLFLRKDELTNKWTRVVYLTEKGEGIIGWIEVEAQPYSVKRMNNEPAPPGCAQPITTLNKLTDTYKTPKDGRIVVNLDLYRADYEQDFPTSAFKFKVDGKELFHKERRFTSKGPFLITDAAVGMDIKERDTKTRDLKAGETVSFSVATSSKQPLFFYAIIYFIPPGIKCNFGN